MRENPRVIQFTNLSLTRYLLQDKTRTVIVVPFLLKSRMNKLACLFLQMLFLSGAQESFISSEKVAHASNVLQRIGVLTDTANYSHAYSRAQMKDIGHTYDSGLEGTTYSKVMSGVPGGATTGGPASIEFAIAPIENDSPSYKKAVFVKSAKDGKYKISLPPGKYWIGAKAKSLDPINYASGAFSFSEKIAVVEEGTFTQVDLFEVGYAP